MGASLPTSACPKPAAMAGHLQRILTGKAFSLFAIADDSGGRSAACLFTFSGPAIDVDGRADLVLVPAALALVTLAQG